MMPKHRTYAYAIQETRLKTAAGPFTAASVFRGTKVSIARLTSKQPRIRSVPASHRAVRLARKPGGWTSGAKHGLRGISVRSVTYR